MKQRRQKLYGATAHIGRKETLEIRIELTAETLSDARDTLKEFFLKEDVKLTKVYRIHRIRDEEES